jgi:hypothetical protein
VFLRYENNYELRIIIDTLCPTVVLVFANVHTSGITYGSLFLREKGLCEYFSRTWKAAATSSLFHINMKLLSTRDCFV